MAREIDENEYAEMKRVTDVAQLIGKHPEARALLQQAVALAAPEQAGPEIRIRNEVNTRLSGIEKLLADDRAERQKEREEEKAERDRRNLDRQWLSGRQKLRDAGYNDEGITKVEEFMEKRSVADHEIAMAAFERENPPPEPVATGGTRWNFFDQRDAGNLGLDALMKGDDDGFLAQALPAALKEGRGG
jgi:hypothetical protein